MTDDGHERHECPTCGHVETTYERAISPAMVAWLRGLAAITDENGVAWVHARHVPARGGDYGKLTAWEVIEPSPEHRGVWRITPRGREFLAGTLAVEPIARVRSGKLLGFVGEPVYVHEVESGPAQGTLFDQPRRKRRRSS